MSKNKILRLRRRDIEALEAIAQLLSADLKNHYTISELAAKSTMNRCKLTYGFKQLFGTSVYQFLLKNRMEHARTLLTTTDMPVQEIGLLTGYRNNENFSHAFKKYYGYSPSSLRRE